LNYALSKKPTNLLCEFFLLGSVGEDDLVNEEENNHRDTTLKEGRAKVVNQVGKEVNSNSCPNAIYSVNNYSYKAPSCEIDGTLIQDITITTECKLSLHQEIDNFTEERSN
jgi:hypothetical protein